MHQSPAAEKEFYTTSTLGGVKAMWHKELRGQGLGHILKPHKPGKPRKIIIRSFSKDANNLHSPNKIKKPRDGAKKITYITHSRFGRSSPRDETVGCINVSDNPAVPQGPSKNVNYSYPPKTSCITHSRDSAVYEILRTYDTRDDPVLPQGPHQKKKRKRKRKRKGTEPPLIQHESKDKNGKNKSTKHVPLPLMSSASSDRNSFPTKAPGPSDELDNRADTTMGSLTQAIFRGTSYSGDLGSSINISVHNDMDVSLAPSPMTYRQVNSMKTAEMGKKRSQEEANVGLKRSRETGSDEGVMSKKEASCSAGKQCEKLRVVQLRNASKCSNSQECQVIDQSQECQIIQEIKTHPINDQKDLSEEENKYVSQCAGSPVSTVSENVSVVEIHNKQIDYVSTSATKQEKTKVSHNRISRLSTGDRIIASEKASYGRVSIPETSDSSSYHSSQKDLSEEENKYVSQCAGSPVSTVSENVSIVEIHNKQIDYVSTSAPKQEKTKVSHNRISRLSMGDRIIASEKATYGRVSIPETSDSSSYHSSNSNIGNAKIEKTASVCRNEVLRREREPKENPDLAVSEVTKDDSKGLTKQSETSEECSGVLSLDHSVSGVSSISSASTEMLDSVGKTCLQDVIGMLCKHFGGTLEESFKVLQKNSFNLINTIQELQVLHLPVKALCSELDENCGR